MRTFITIAIALCLTAPLLAAKNTCVSPCITCSGTAEALECATCYGKPLKAGAAEGDLKFCDAAGTMITDCLVQDGTTCTTCKAGFAPQFTSGATCVEATGAQKVTNCFMYTDSDPTGTPTCTACSGDFYPTQASGTDPWVCTTAASGTDNCAAYSSATACVACKAEFVFKTNDASCVAYSDANRGCLSTTGDVCGTCNAAASYYATGYVAASGSTCTKNSTIMMIKIAFALVIASLF